MAQKENTKEKNGEFACKLLNARSIVSKVVDLETMVYEEDPDVVLITETWTNKHIQQAEIAIPGYDIIRKDRSGRKGEGCVAYLREALKATALDELMNDNTESVWCKIRVNDGDIVVGVCYRSPTANEEEKASLHQRITEICDCYDQVVVCGDFNYSTIDWELLHADPEGQQFLDLVMDKFLTQHVKEPTREQNILDLVLSSHPALVKDVYVSAPLGSSDHNIVNFNINIGAEKDTWKQYYHDYRRAKYNDMRKEFSKIKWREIFQGKNVSGMWKAFLEEYQRIVKVYVPVRCRNERKRKPLWWNTRIYQARRNKLRWWKRYQETECYDDYLNYKNAMNRTRKLKRQAKKKCEEKIAGKAKENPKAYYRYANSKLKAKENVGPLEDKSGNLVYDDKEMGEILNKYCFIYIYQEILNTILFC